LKKLCSFSDDQKWKLIYKGSLDGFSSKDFHSRCDSIEKTITIIKSNAGHIFGGYTDKAWSSKPGYIYDSNAFLFNLVNNSYQSLKIKCSDPEHAILNDLNYGPRFGKARKGTIDLWIKLDSTKTKASSNLGGSYKVPGLNRARPEEASVLRSYLAGSEQSKIIDIEVFCKI